MGYTVNLLLGGLTVQWKRVLTKTMPDFADLTWFPLNTIVATGYTASPLVGDWLDNGNGYKQKRCEAPSKDPVDLTGSRRTAS